MLLLVLYYCVYYYCATQARSSCTSEEQRVHLELVLFLLYWGGTTIELRGLAANAHILLTCNSYSDECEYYRVLRTRTTVCCLLSVALPICFH